MRLTAPFIVFEGADKAGKTTLCDRVELELHKIGYPVHRSRLPGKTPGTLGELVYRLHHEPHLIGINDIDPTSLQVLHAAAHIDNLTKLILPAHRQGDWILQDRYWWSTIVYGKVLGADPEVLAHLECIARKQWARLPKPLTFLIERRDVDPELRDEYRSIAAREMDSVELVRIDNDTGLDDVIDQIMDHISKRCAPQIPAVHIPAPVRVTPVFDTYWRFAFERQAVLMRRVKGSKPPWTNDSIILKHRFTNAYRAADRVSQYLIRHAIYDQTWPIEDLFLRVVLFKLFNRIETWEALQHAVGPICTKSFCVDKYAKTLSRMRDRGETIYSGAYIMPPVKFGRSSKHANHLEFLAYCLHEGVPGRLGNAKSLSEVFQVLVGLPGLGQFLAFQYAIDLNYSPLINFDEMSFVVAGPGARDGIRKCFSALGGLNEAEIIRWVADRQEREFERLGLPFEYLGGRRLQLIDCQNLFCEVDKYARVAHPEAQGISGRTRIKQSFTARSKPVDLWFPPKWGINDKLPTSNAQEDTQHEGLFGTDSERSVVRGRSTTAGSRR
jgi:thymidylate kinase